MDLSYWSELLWGEKAKVRFLFIAALFLLLTLLGSREIWTQEHRWADIVSGMFFRHDFLHPYLGQSDYYDKPLLSYWLIAGIAAITGELSTWALRLPSAFAGVLAIWSIYRLGVCLKDRQLGLLSGWLLLTTFYFIFWAKTSSADMLNLAGSLFAVSWYFEKKNHTSFLVYAIFFVILALTSLCKGLVGAVIALLAVFVDIVIDNQWKKHLRIEFFLALIPAIFLYLLPFWASSHFGGNHYGQDGLYLVYRENVLRYLQPFDHKGPFYTYFIYLPVYLFPWVIFFVPALTQLKSRWKHLTTNTQWIYWTVLLLFIFFTLSGSRRNYYILPVVPFAILLSAEWVLAGRESLQKRYSWTGNWVVIAFLLLFISFNILQPLYYSKWGVSNFVTRIKREASKTQPWSQWNVILLDSESKLQFYFGLSPTIKNYAVYGPRETQTLTSLLQTWPFLKEKQSNAIFITRKRYQPFLQTVLSNYRVIESDPSLGEKLWQTHNVDASIAFIPNQIPK